MSNMSRTGSESRAAKTDLAYFTVADFFSYYYYYKHCIVG